MVERELQCSVDYRLSHPSLRPVYRPIDFDGEKSETVILHRHHRII